MSLPSRPSSATPASTHHKVGDISVGFSKPLWWVMFGLDAVILSWFFQCFKSFTTEPALMSGGLFVLAMLALLSCTTALIYDGYAREKAKGLVKNTVPLFDKLYAYQSHQRKL